MNLRSKSFFYTEIENLAKTKNLYVEKTFFVTEEFLPSLRPISRIIDKKIVGNSFYIIKYDKKI